MLGITIIGRATHEDTTKTIKLKEVSITDNKKSSLAQMPEQKDGVIYTGKKTEVILLNKVNADLSTNNTRQIFAKIPGINIWENDGSGTQVAISTRGLNPNRSWEFNVRQNGYDISSEVFGYPEAYYQPPMEALEKIELIRGASSLSFGPQFGGLLNYVIKSGNKEKPIEIESRQTIGSYNLFNSYNAIGGTIKKINYYAYFHTRSADGWRQNSAYRTYSGYLSINYQASKKLSFGLEYTKMSYLNQQAGGLTDSMFQVNHRQSIRARNWFSTPWNVGAVKADYQISENSNIHLRIFTLLSQRNSVGFLKTILIQDTINPILNAYNARQVDRDRYENYGAELRYMLKYKFLQSNHTLTAGVRYYTGTTYRKQGGIGTTGNNFDLTITSLNNGKEYTREMNYQTLNYAVFAENKFTIGKKLNIVPGIRYENLVNTSVGHINTSATGEIAPNSRLRNFVLFGTGIEYLISQTTHLYANYSQAYRPVTFSELTPSATNEIIDQKLKDMNGYNVDLGYRGRIKDFLQFDAGVFYLSYNNRIGTYTLNGNPYKTNIGASESKGIESFIEFDPIAIFNSKPRYGNILLFASYAYIEAKYIQWNNPLTANTIEKNWVEYAPNTITRTGITYICNYLSATLQYSYTGKFYTDAQNTLKANPAATAGMINAYQVIDFNFAYTFAKKYTITAGINNLTNERYATRRAAGYPGPGLIPGNARTLYFTLQTVF
jgi:Fe(3+) dicitrate transport protein